MLLGGGELLRCFECGEVFGARRADLLDFPKQLWLKSSEQQLSRRKSLLMSEENWSYNSHRLAKTGQQTMEQRFGIR